MLAIPAVVGAFPQQVKLTASDGAAFDRFGVRVDHDGNTVVVGAFLDDVGANVDQGSAYVFTRKGSTWVEEAKLTASDGAVGDQFGVSVAVHGATVVVGAAGDDVAANVDQGSAYVFTRKGSTWVEEAKLTASDGAAGDRFGDSAAAHGSTVVVGASRDDVDANVDQGSAYAFVRDGSTWALGAQLTGSDGTAGDRFGVSVAVHGGTVVAGAFEDTGAGFVGPGSAYVFARNSSTWAEEAKLTASDGVVGDRFGRSVALRGGTVVVSADADDVGANLDQGSAYVFTRDGPNWEEEIKLTASDGAAGDEFGTSVTVHGGTIVVGAFADDVGANVDQGSAYVFTQKDSSWAEEAKLTALDGAAGDQFGISVAMHGGTIVVGADAHDVGANVDQGSAYAFSNG